MVKECCDFKANSQVQLLKHVLLKHPKKEEEKQFNCSDCDFQGSDQSQLSRHVTLKHTTRRASVAENLACKNCGERFGQK